MILLSLSLFLQYNLLQCVVFEKVDYYGLLKAHNHNSSLRNDTPGVYQLDPITPEYAFFTPPDDFHLTPTLEEIVHQTRRSQNIHDSPHKISNIYFRNLFFGHHSRPKKHGFTVLDISKISEERLDSQEKASSDNSREHDTSERISSESEQKGLMYQPVKYIPENTYPRSKVESSRERVFHRTRRPKTGSPATLKTRRTKNTTKHKQLKPNLLLPMNTINDSNPVNDAAKKKMTPPKSKHELNFDGNDALERKKPRKDKHEGISGDDNDIFQRMRLRNDKVKQALRMHVIPKTTKKMLFPYRLLVEYEEQTKHTKTLMTATTRQSHRHDRNTENDAVIFKKTPRSKHEWNFDGNDVLKRKKPHKDKHKGSFGDDKDIFKMMKLKMDKKNIARMHVILDTTKKIWYSDRMLMESEEEIEVTTTSMPVTTRQLLRQTPDNDWSRYDESNEERDTTVSTIIKHKYASSSMEYLRAPLSKNYFFKIMEHRREGYMTVFLIELMHIIATKDKRAAHDVIKHADPIIHRQSRQLRWMGHPLLDVTRKIATMLKVMDITSIQAQAVKFYHQLLQRHDSLPVAVNTILEYAETLYDDDEGMVLFDGLRELVNFPKIALSGYWLCNSLINAFLRPFRRLKDTQQLKELMNSINMALKSQNHLRSNQKLLHRSGRGFGAQAHGPAVDNQPPPQKDSSNQIEPEINTRRPPWKRKRKRHLRNRKIKRDNEDLLLRHRNQRLTLTSVTPRTVRSTLRDYTYAAYIL